MQRGGFAAPCSMPLEDAAMADFKFYEVDALYSELPNIHSLQPLCPAAPAEFSTITA